MLEGTGVGIEVGYEVGREVGIEVGYGVGCLVGLTVGDRLGFADGLAFGLFVGLRVVGAGTAETAVRETRDRMRRIRMGEWRNREKNEKEAFKRALSIPLFSQRWYLEERNGKERRGNDQDTFNSLQNGVFSQYLDVSCLSFIVSLPRAWRRNCTERCRVVAEAAEAVQEIDKFLTCTVCDVFFL